MRFKLQAWLAVLVTSGGVCLAEAPARWVPDECLAESPARSVERDPAALETVWNEAYRAGVTAIETGDFPLAWQQMCVALLAARHFEARDWRFAETLDELGLIAFQRSDYDRAERVQGAAIAEMLLAVGPHGEPFRAGPASDSAPIRPDCRSGVTVYTTRLGWILERMTGRITLDEIEGRPWRIFAAGYLPLDDELAGRLDWLVSRYLLEENFTAADDLASLQQKIRGGR